MRNRCCCNNKSGAAVAERSWARAVRRVMSWLVPGIVLAAMPKCPLCLAAYVALFMGFGISLAAAEFAWWFVTISCAAALIYLAAIILRRYMNFQ